MREPGLLSVVAPLHDEEDNVEAFHRRTLAALDGLTFELVLVDDGSRDATGEKLRALAAEDKRVKVIALSRNFGHQAAISAGLEHARGDVVVMIDADLQDPPELIPEMLDALAQGRRRRLRRALLAGGRDALQARHGALVLQAVRQARPGRAGARTRATSA